MANHPLISGSRLKPPHVNLARDCYEAENTSILIIAHDAKRTVLRCIET